ncbi:Transcriptional regulatory protein moc3 [Fusarium oxysporum f. sp. cubense race 1]|uniref:Transcriptional regulatory protein moc3 n=1 Tax=Fusarium oxysporum f. sp. cubense (strain race 1) TaxID=1229664 RepID=N4UHK7_FUSC1|nr:Transcriptional regulatory protein moc3 [Fusarium oxysporum f. sp. cubense race 1]
MYGPAPHRPSKTGARRSKSGCVSCRKRRRKCDESKPRCNRCLSANIECSYNTKVEFRDATVWAAQKVKRRIIHGTKEHGTPTPSESQNRYWPCFQPSPPSECDIANNNDIPASAGQVTGSPNNHVESNDVNQKQDTDLDGHVASDDTHKRQSERGQTVQPVELTPSDRDRVYLAHFMSQMIDLIPGQVKCLGKMAIQSEPIRLCANALAAASLANRGGRFSNDGAGRWVPMQTHYSRALSFASRSMDTIQSSPGIFPGCRVIMLILMLCYQLELGCIGEIYHTLSVLDSTIFSYRDAILLLEFGHGLVQCWLGLRALCEGTLQPLALFRGESQTEHVVSELQDLTTTTSQAFGIIAAKAYRISRRILLFRCTGDNEKSTSTIASRFSQWWSVIKCQEADDATGTYDLGGHLSEDKLFCELARLRDALDISEVPAGLPLNFDPSVPAPSTTTPEPLYLADHEQAMELADYASAQIVCDESSIQTLGSPAFQRGPSRNPWLHLLLRIAAGLDAEKCLTRNRYRQGICHYLQCAVFLLQDLEAAHFLGGLLQRLMDAGGSYEDCFTPLSLSSQCNKLFCQELMRGRTVFMLCPTYNAWTTKEVLFSRGDHECFIIFGRDADGLYLKDMVELEESPTGNLEIL